MLKTYRGPFPIYRRGCEFSLGTRHSGGLSMTQSRVEEHNARKIICLYNNAMLKDMIELVILLQISCSLSKKLSIAKRVAAYNAGDTDKFARLL